MNPIVALLGKRTRWSLKRQERGGAVPNHLEVAQVTPQRREGSPLLLDRLGHPSPSHHNPLVTPLPGDGRRMWPTPQSLLEHRP